MTNEYVLKIPAKLEGMDVILAFVSLLLDRKYPQRANDERNQRQYAQRKEAWNGL